MAITIKNILKKQLKKKKKELTAHNNKCLMVKAEWSGLIDVFFDTPKGKQFYILTTNLQIKHKGLPICFEK